MPAVSEFTKAKIVTLHQRGMSYGQISTNLGLSKGTIHAIMRKWEHTGTVVQVLEEGGCLPWNRTRHPRTIMEICACP
jgi:transposase